MTKEMCPFLRSSCCIPIFCWRGFGAYVYFIFLSKKIKACLEEKDRQKCLLTFLFMTTTYRRSVWNNNTCNHSDRTPAMVTSCALFHALSLPALPAARPSACSAVTSGDPAGRLLGPRCRFRLSGVRVAVGGREGAFLRD